MKGKQTNKHQANTARYRRFGLDEQTVYSHYQTASRTRRHFPIPMGPNENETRRLFTSSPRHQEAVQLPDEDLRRDLEKQQQQQHYRNQEQQQFEQQQHQQQGQGEGADIQIVGVVFGPNEDQEVRSWKMFAGNVRW
mgnify:CR=1 FL=1